MNDVRIKSTQNPYHHLFIYYIKGKVPNHNSKFNEKFLGNWEEDGFSFLFFSEPCDRWIKYLISTHPELELLDQFDMSFEQWHGGKIQPIQIGRFILMPPWESVDPSDGLIPIVIDPGVVFGTGKHPTTSDCLDLLCALCKSEQIKSVLDLGTGTGILAIGAARLGCQKVIAVDLNLLAVQTAKKNVSLNQLDNHILVIQGNAIDTVSIRTDLMIANIHFDVMEKLLLSDGFLNHRWFILSGLLRSQAVKIGDLFHQLPVQLIEERKQDGIWHTFIGKIQK